MKILGIDYGTKRVGVALSDDSAKFAIPQKVIQNNSSTDKENIIEEVSSFAKSNSVETIIMGESRNYDGQPNKILPDILKFKEKLESRGFNVILEPEFMTSQQAERFQGKNDMTDASAAALILQAYLDKRDK